MSEFDFVGLAADGPTEDFIARRRMLIDRYALIAQLSSVLVIFIVKIFIYLARAAKSPHHMLKAEKPGFPYLKPSQWKAPVNHIVPWKLYVRKLEWWLAGTFFDDFWGTRGQWVVTLIWTAWLALFSLIQTDFDPIHVARRIGLVGASQLPIHYLLIVKSRYNPFTLIFDRSHEELTWVHRALGRILVGMFVVHTIIYTWFFFKLKIMIAVLQHIIGITGYIAITLMGTLTLSSIAYVRMAWFKSFYWIHVVFGFYVLLVLLHHTRYIRIYVFETAAVFMLNVVLRWASTTKHEGVVSMVGTTGLLKVEIPLDGAEGRKAALKWHPGQHVYISPVSRQLVKLTPAYLTKNPFTIVNLSPYNGNGSGTDMILIARSYNGETKRLAEKAAVAPATMKFRIEGPYGSSHRFVDFERLQEYSSVLMVAGGVGGTYITPLWATMLAQLATPLRTRFVWAVRSFEEAECIFRDVFPPSVVYVTSETADLAGLTAMFGEQSVGGRVDEAAPLLPGPQPIRTRHGIALKQGRPDMEAVVKESFIGATDKVCVIVCGPKGMVNAVRNEVGQWVADGACVDFHAECYSA